MWDKFGEFDSAEELNRAAAAQKAEGDREALIMLAEENGIDRDDAEDYLDGVVDELVTPLMAAVGKLQIEAADLELRGILKDWEDCILELCRKDRQMQIAIRRREKKLKGCMAMLLKYSFENKCQVSDEIIKATKVMRNGRTEPLRGPVYMGVPDRAKVKELIQEYYLGGQA